MSDEPISGGLQSDAGAAPAATPAQAAPAATPAQAEPAATQTPSASPAPAPASSTPSPSKSASPSTAKSAWYGDDWRGQLASDIAPEIRDRAAAKLGRYSSPSEIVKALLSGESKISELATDLQSRVKIPGPDATPEERAEYHKAIGVPDEPGKYSVYENENAKWDDNTRAEISEFIKDAHAAGLSQTQVDVALKSLDRARVYGLQQMQQRAQKVAAATTEQLRSELGRGYIEHIELGNRQMREIWGDHAPDIANIRLQDGSNLGDNLCFIKVLGEMARQAADMGAPEIGDAALTVSRDQRLDELYGYINTNPQKYKSDSVQREIADLESRKKGGRR